MWSVKYVVGIIGGFIAGAYIVPYDSKVGNSIAFAVMALSLLGLIIASFRRLLKGRNTGTGKRPRVFYAKGKVQAIGSHEVAKDGTVTYTNVKIDGDVIPSIAFAGKFAAYVPEVGDEVELAYVWRASTKLATPENTVCAISDRDTGHLVMETYKDMRFHFIGAKLIQVGIVAGLGLITLPIFGIGALGLFIALGMVLLFAVHKTLNMPDNQEYGMITEALARSAGVGVKVLA
jgi:hypothetical protein